MNNLTSTLLTIALVYGSGCFVCAGDFENVRLRLVNGSSIRATIESIDENGQITGSDILAGVTLSEIVGIDTGRKLAVNETNKVIVLRMGGTIPINEYRIENDQLKIVLAGSEMALPIEVVRAVVETDSKLVKSTIAEPSNEFDSIVVSTKRGAVVVPGLLESVDSTHATISHEGESKRISRKKILAIVPADLGGDDPDGVIATVTLTDGSRIVGVVRSFSNDTLNLRLSVSDDFKITVERIAKIAFQSERVVYLSDIEPQRVEQRSQFAAARKWQRDSSLLGNSIRLKYGSTGRVLDFEKGIGTRSYTSLVFRNDNDFSHLRGVVGIDMETGGHGDCEMVVEGDGIRLWSKRIQADGDPEPLVVDIKGIDEIALVVLPGEAFDLADHADWADVRFTKSD